MANINNEYDHFLMENLNIVNELGLTVLNIVDIDHPGKEITTYGDFELDEDGNRIALETILTDSFDRCSA